MRIKAFLIVRRNQLRDHLDVAAISAHLGTTAAARILSRIDDFYGDLRGAANSSADRVASQLVRQLGHPPVIVRAERVAAGADADRDRPGSPDSRGPD